MVYGRLTSKHFPLDKRNSMSNVIGGVMTPPYETHIKINLSN